MLYFSELRDKQVYTEDNIKIGLLDDLIFVASAEPMVTKIVVRQDGENTIIPFRYIRKVKDVVVVQKAFEVDVLTEGELFVMRNVVDKQIIDLIGSKVVRVNDVVIQERSVTNEYELYIAGVDVGSLGIARWFRLDHILMKVYRIIGRQSSPKVLPWSDIQPLELARGKVMLKKEEEKLDRMRAEDLADYLEKTSEYNVRKFLKILEKDKAAKVISNLNINYQKNLFHHWRPEKAASMLEYIDDTECVDILFTMSKKKRYEIIHLLSPRKRQEIHDLLHLSRTPIGKRITTEYLTVKSNLTVREVIAVIKREAVDFSFLASIYVLNNNQELVGVFNLHELILQQLDTPVYKFMIQNLIEIRLSTPLEIVVKKLLKYRLPALPVVDDAKRLLGLITFDSVTDVFEKKLFN